jgi:alpha-L-rhamnosidase
VLMIHDYMMYRNDPVFVQTFLPGIKRVLDHFKRYLTADNMMTEQPYWDFIDHSFSTKKVLEASHFKKLTTNSLFYSYTLSRAADIFSFFNEHEQARAYAILSQKLKEGVQKQCWDAGSQMFADTPDKKSFSMHSNILAVLCGMMTKDDQQKLLKAIVSNKAITPTTLYFDFYLGRAMSQAGAGDLYYELLSKWKDLLKLGLTTFPEGVSRSDCHAWSASPDFEMPATLAGIEPQVPGFKKVIVRPQLQKLASVEATVAHWAGEIKVAFRKEGRGLSGFINLPDGIHGRLEWRQRVVELKPGENKIEIE